ncbi:RRP15-like protein isoform X1 [Aedes aegypti]|uniref:RRP15-like protein n=1 Tax=Aedes aegypti TaxID=7159 RepID=A0A6I8T9Q3_AEDAE|nr:RRP15-like protein isoform X1 [Aedes aegypti]
MTAKVKTSKKMQSKTTSHPEPDTDSASDQSDHEVADDQHMSDEEFPMSDDDQMQADSDGEAEEEKGPSKWALTLAKYIRKSDDAQILSKAVKEVDLEKRRQEAKPTYKFEVVGEQKKPAEAGDQKDEKPDDLEMAKELLRQKALLKKERQKDILGLRIKPSIGQYERERALKKIATRGTVQLFNAVRQQQRDVSKKLDEAGKLEYKRDKVLKNLSKKEFLNVLMSGPRAKSELVDNLVKKEEVKDEIKSEDESDDDEPKSTWGALRADFLTGKKSGWDKEDSDKDENVGDPMDESSDSD